jgi:hypothetical protein
MRDPHGMGKATLLEVQFPVGGKILPSREHLTSMPRVQEIHGAPPVPSTSGTNGSEPFQGKKKTTYPVLDTYQTTGTRDRLPVLQGTHGDGVPIVRCVQESCTYREGAP